MWFEGVIQYHVAIPSIHSLLTQAVKRWNNHMESINVVFLIIFITSPSPSSSFIIVIIFYCNHHHCHPLSSLSSTSTVFIVAIGHCHHCRYTFIIVNSYIVQRQCLLLFITLYYITCILYSMLLHVLFISVLLCTAPLGSLWDRRERFINAHYYHHYYYY